MHQTRLRTPHRGLLAGALTLAAAGCSTINAVAGPSAAELDEAVERRDVAYLQEVCAKGKEREERDFMRGDATQQERRACSLASGLEQTLAAEGEAAALEAFKTGLSCENAVSSLAAYGAETGDENDYADAFEASGRKLAECGDYPALVQELAPMARVEGGLTQARQVKDLLVALAEGDAALVGKLAAVAEGNTFSFDDSWIPARAIAGWLIDIKERDSCSAYLGALQSPDLDAAKAFILYHGEVECAPAAGSIVGYLESEDADTRLLACEALGRIADPAYLKQLEIVAQSDSAYTTDGLVQTYYVRDACREAAGRTRLKQ